MSNSETIDIVKIKEVFKDIFEFMENPNLDKYFVDLMNEHYKKKEKEEKEKEEKEEKEKEEKEKKEKNDQSVPIPIITQIINAEEKLKKNKELYSFYKLLESNLFDSNLFKTSKGLSKREQLKLLICSLFHIKFEDINECDLSTFKTNLSIIQKGIEDVVATAKGTEYITGRETGEGDGKHPGDEGSNGEDGSGSGQDEGEGEGEGVANGKHGGSSDQGNGQDGGWGASKKKKKKKGKKKGKGGGGSNESLKITTFLAKIDNAMEKTDNAMKSDGRTIGEEEIAALEAEINELNDEFNSMLLPDGNQKDYIYAKLFDLLIQFDKNKSEGEDGSDSSQGEGSSDPGKGEDNGGAKDVKDHDETKNYVDIIIDKINKFFSEKTNVFDIKDTPLETNVFDIKDTPLETSVFDIEDIPSEKKEFLESFTKKMISHYINNISHYVSNEKKIFEKLDLKREYNKFVGFIDFTRKYNNINKARRQKTTFDKRTTDTTRLISELHRVFGENTELLDTLKRFEYIIFFDILSYCKKFYRDINDKFKNKVNEEVHSWEKSQINVIINKLDKLDALFDDLISKLKSKDGSFQIDHHEESNSGTGDNYGKYKAISSYEVALLKKSFSFLRISFDEIIKILKNISILKQSVSGPLIGDQEITISINNNSPFLLYFLFNIYKFIQYLAKQKDVLKEIERNDKKLHYKTSDIFNKYRKFMPSNRSEEKQPVTKETEEEQRRKRLMISLSYIFNNERYY